MACAFLFSAPAWGQTLSPSSIPGVVTKALKQKFPASSNAKVTWERENGNYEANWGGKSGEDHSIQFSPSGAFVNMEIAISASQLPKGAVSYVAAHDKGTKISEAGKITDAQGTVTYEVEMKGKDLIFDSQGNFLKSGSGD
ncbi:MAG TPA: PepSY-like domain-containing protein [Chitinophagaceae bacterium]|nr:PepSY-like domain-containing protein [Chitinophagaceae bacterium]